MALLDWRYKLAYWHDAKRTIITVLAAMAIFILWDFLGIFLGIFIHGDSPYQLPFTLAPHFPLEEVLFLCLLTYCSLVIYNGVSKWRSRI
jgi:lycopene cyclase domain-containing protein